MIAVEQNLKAVEKLIDVLGAHDNEEFQSKILDFISNDPEPLSIKLDVLKDIYDETKKTRQAIVKVDHIQKQIETINTLIIHPGANFKTVYKHIKEFTKKELKKALDKEMRSFLKNVINEDFFDMPDLAEKHREDYLLEYGSKAQKTGIKNKRKLKAKPPKNAIKKKKGNSPPVSKVKTSPTALEQKQHLIRASKKLDESISSFFEAIANQEQAIKRIEDGLKTKILGSNPHSYTRELNRVEYLERAIKGLSKHNKTLHSHLFQHAKGLLNDLKEQNCDVEEYEGQFNDLYLDFTPPLSNKEKKRIFNPSFTSFIHEHRATPTNSNDVDMSDIAKYQNTDPKLFQNIFKKRTQLRDLNQNSCLLRQYKDHLRACVREADRAIADIRQKHGKLSETKDALRNMYSNLRVIAETAEAFQRVCDNFNAQAEYPPLSEIREWAKNNLTHVFLTKNAIKGAEQSIYKEPETIFEALITLDTEASALINSTNEIERAKNIELFEHRLNQLGLEYGIIREKNLSKKHRAAYTCYYNNEAHHMDWHLKKGVSGDDRHKLRIHGAVTKDKKIIVGHMKEHLPVLGHH